VGISVVSKPLRFCKFVAVSKRALFEDFPEVNDYGCREYENVDQVGDYQERRYV